MAGENEAVTLLKWKVDTASEQVALAGNRRIAESYSSISAAAKTFSTDVMALNPQISAAANAAAAAEATVVTEKTKSLALTQRLAEAELVRKSRVEETALAELRAATLAGGGDGFGSRQVGGAISKASRAVWNLPDMQLGGGLSTTVLSRVGLMGGAAAEGLGLTVTGLAGIAAVAVPVVAGAVAISNALSEAEATAKKYAAAQVDVNTLIAGGATTKDLEAARDAARARMEGAQNTADRGQYLLDTYKNAATTYGYVLEAGTKEQADVLRANMEAQKQALADYFGLDTGGLLDQASFLHGVQSGLKDLQDRADEAAISFSSANAAVESGAGVAGDLKEAEEALAEARIQAQLDYADLVLKVDGMTAEQREKRARQVAREIELLQREIDTGNASGEAADTLRLRILELNGEYLELTTTTKTYADALERQQTALDNINKHIDMQLEALDQEVAAREVLLDIQNKMADIATKRDADILREQEAQRERVLEATAQGEERRAEIIADSEARIGKIVRDAARDLFDAVAGRDALGFTRTTRRRDDALLDAQGETAKAFERVDKQLAKTVESELKGLDKRVAAITLRADEATDIEAKRAAEQTQIIKSALASQAFLTENSLQHLSKVQEEAAAKALKESERGQDELYRALDKGNKHQIDAAQESATKKLNIERSKAMGEEAIAAKSTMLQVNIAEQGAAAVLNQHVAMYSTMASIAYSYGRNVAESLFSGLNSVPFPSLTSTYGAAIPSTQAQFNQRFDARMAQTLGIGYGQIRR